MPLSYSENTQRKHTRHGRFARVFAVLRRVGLLVCWFAHDGRERGRGCVARFCMFASVAKIHAQRLSARRGRAFRFIHFARFFVSLFLSFFFHSLFFVPCLRAFPFSLLPFLFVSYPVFFLPFLSCSLFPCLVLSFFAFLHTPYFYYIIIIINIYFVCVCAYVHTRARAREERGEKQSTKKRATKIAAL